MHHILALSFICTMYVPSIHHSLTSTCSYTHSYNTTQLHQKSSTIPFSAFLFIFYNFFHFKTQHIMSWTLHHHHHHHTLAHHIMSCHVISVTSCHISHIMSCHVMSYHISHIMSCHIMSYLCTSITIPLHPIAIWCGPPSLHSCVGHIAIGLGSHPCMCRV